MAEPFKNLLNRNSVVQMADAFRSVWSKFDHPRFIALAATEIETLEFKARAMLIATALEATLPARFDRAADILETSLGPPVPLDTDGEPISIANQRGGEGLSGWPVWAMGELVARRGQGNIPRALSCLHALTQRFSAEFAIRPFIDNEPEIVFPILDRWIRDESPHVRRLVSEGSRPRLPWGLRLQALVRDPSPTLPLLLNLQDDPSSYVRRSVANHLNDIAKDHPDRVATWVRTHLERAPDSRIQLLRHASRHLIKQGHAPTLSAWSLDAGFTGKVKLHIEKKKVRVGESLPFVVELESGSTAEQKLVIDYAVHYRKANGALTAKVFKGWKLTLAAGDVQTLTKSHSFKLVTTRTLYPGAHRIEVQVNGQRFAGKSFELLATAD